MTQETGVAPWLKDHLWAILAAALAAYGGYLTGMTTLNHRVAEVEKDVIKLEAKYDALAPRVERLDVMVHQAQEERDK